MADDYARKWKIYGRSGVDCDVPTLSPNPLIAAKTTSPSGTATRTIKVQRLIFTPSVWATGTLQLIDSVTKKVVAAVQIPDRPMVFNGSDGGSVVKADFGSQGVALAAGSHLLLGLTGGSAGRLQVDAYQSW